MTDNTISAKKELQKSSLTRALLFTGLLAGTLDITAATIHFLSLGGKDPVRILLYIASAVFGEAAYEWGAIMPVLGLMFHYIIAFCWATLFFLMYPKMPVLSKNKYISGVVYAVLVWLVMNLIVVPLSNVQRAPFDLTRALVGMGILMIAIGLPISLMAHRYYQKHHSQIGSS